MIKINLATKKTAVSAAGGEGTRLGTGLVKFDVRLDDLKELPLKRIGLCLVAILLLNHLIETDRADRMAKLMADIETAQAQKDQLKPELEKIRGYDELKAALDSDEKMVRLKITTISELIEDRKTPPKVLIALSEGIPENVWLKAFKIGDEKIQIEGFSVGFNYISEFMRNVSQSAYFEDVKLVESRQERSATATTDAIASFSLEARRKKVSQ